MSNKKLLLIQTILIILGVILTFIFYKIQNQNKIFFCWINTIIGYFQITFCITSLKYLTGLFSIFPFLILLIILVMFSLYFFIKKIPFFVINIISIFLWFIYGIISFYALLSI